MSRKMFVIAWSLIFGLFAFAQMDREHEVQKMLQEQVKSGKLTQEEADKKFYEEMAKEMVKKNVSITFYGKVIDQDGTPVTQAVVKCGISAYSLNPLEFMTFKETVVQTNSEGIFEVKDKRGESITIKEIIKDGYEDSFYVTNKSAKYTDYGYVFEHRMETSKRPDLKSPEIFKIRKKGEPVLLLTHSSNFAFKKGEGKKYTINSVSTYLGMALLEDAQRKGKRIDIILSCEYENGAYIFSIEPIGDRAGVIASNEKPYMASETGYLPKYRTTIKDAPMQDKQILYFLVKSGDPSVYSRLTVELRTQDSGSENARLAGKYDSACNPYGGRELEQVWGLDDYRQLENQAWNSLIKEKKYPLKPDFKALQKEAKKKTAN
jgi:hypothetical protein